LRKMARYHELAVGDKGLHDFGGYQAFCQGKKGGGVLHVLLSGFEGDLGDRGIIAFVTRFPGVQHIAVILGRNSTGFHPVFSKGRNHRRMF